jgi:hypothetical protein
MNPLPADSVLPIVIVPLTGGKVEESGVEPTYGQVPFVLEKPSFLGGLGVPVAIGPKTTLRNFSQTTDKF